MDTSEQDVNAAVDQLFDGSTPETESQETSADGQATAGEQSQTSEAESQQEGQGAQEGQVAEQFFAEVAGRKYPTKEDFIRSHETVLQKLQRQEQDSRAWKQTHERWGKWESAMTKDPAFYRHMRDAEARYVAAKQAGATNAQAKQAAQSPQSLPPEVMKRLEAVDRLQEDFVERQQERADTQLQSEMTALQTAHKLDAATMKKVTGVMLEVAEKTGLEVSAEWAYRDLRAREANSQLLKTQVELKRVKGADSAPASPGAPAPKRKVGDLSRREEEAAITSWLDSMGVQEPD